jgi:hypothetical protein
MSLQGATRTDPCERNYRTRLLPWMSSGCLPHILTASASGLYLFAAQCPTPPIPLFTLRRAPRDAQRKTRGQSGSLLLLRKNFAFSASYRFSPAH